MTKTKITWNGKKVTLAGYGVKKYQMARLGAVAMDSILKRTEQGVGSDDAPMPPLKAGYARWKQRLGLKPIRDLRGPGRAQRQDRKAKRWIAVTGKGNMHMLDGFRVSYADERSVRLDITTGIGRLRGRANETAIRKAGGAGWWGFSGKDSAAVMKAASQILGAMLWEIRGRFSGSKQSMPIWMDPKGLMDAGSLRKAA
jgi:hypothetical protein